MRRMVFDIRNAGNAKNVGADMSHHGIRALAVFDANAQGHAMRWSRSYRARIAAAGRLAAEPEITP